MTPLTLLPQDAHVSLHFILASVAFVYSSLSLISTDFSGRYRNHFSLPLHTEK